MPRAFKTIFPTNLSTAPKHARLLGVAIAQWGYTEEALCHVLAELLGCPIEPAEAVFYAIKNEQVRVDLIRRLLRLSVPEEKPRLSLGAALKLFLTEVPIRNRYAHGLWKADSRGRIGLIATGGGPLNRFKRTTVTLKELRAFIARTTDIERDVLSALGDIRYASHHRVLKQRGRPHRRTARRRKTIPAKP